MTMKLGTALPIELERAFEECERNGNWAGASQILSSAATTARQNGQYDLMRCLADQAIEVAKQHGLHVIEISQRLMLFRFLLAACRTEADGRGGL
jgi:hypothetical protein